MINRLAAPVAALCLAAAAPVSAQDYTFQVSGAEKTVEVEESTAVTLAFDKPFQELSIGAPDMADIATLSETLVYLLGKSVGKTTLTIIGDAQRMDLAHVEVVVYRDIAPMQGFLTSAAKGVMLARDGVTVTAAGCVASGRERAAMDSVLGEMKDWGYVVLTNVGEC